MRTLNTSTRKLCAAILAVGGGGVANYKGGCEQLLFGHFSPKTDRNYKSFDQAGRP